MARTSAKTGPRGSSSVDAHRPWPTRREREGGVAPQVVIPQQRPAPVPAARPGALQQVLDSPVRERSDAATDALLAAVPPFGTPPFGTRGGAADPRQHGAGRPRQHRATVGARPQSAHQRAPGAPRNGFGITALCLALAGLPFALIPLTGLVAASLGALAVVFGLLGWSRARRGVATNRTMSAIGTALGLLILGVGIAGVVILVRATGALVGDLDDLGALIPAVTPAVADTAGAAAAAGATPGLWFRSPSPDRE